MSSRLEPKVIVQKFNGKIEFKKLRITNWSSQKIEPNDCYWSTSLCQQFLSWHQFKAKQG